jgi:hypothetical protein
MELLLKETHYDPKDPIGAKTCFKKSSEMARSRVSGAFNGFLPSVHRALKICRTKRFLERGSNPKGLLSESMLALREFGAARRHRSSMGPNASFPRSALPTT